MTWMCSKCFKRYSMLQLVQLPMVQGNPEEAYLPVCVCGNVFHRDKWRWQEVVAGPDGIFWVSTVCLEIDYQMWRPPGVFYETMVFSEMDRQEGHYSDVYCERYATQEQAEAGHKRVSALIQQGRLDVYPTH